MSNTCRKCIECANASHHWLPNSDLGNEDFSGCQSRSDYVCKHCGAFGNECAVCQSTGADEDGDDCVECDGEGVIPTCPECDGSGLVDSGGFEPNGKSIDVPCSTCNYTPTPRSPQ